MYVRGIFLTWFILLLVLNFAQTDFEVGAFFSAEQRETTESESFEGGLSPFDDAFVRPSWEKDFSRNKTLQSCVFYPHTFAEIPSVQVYLLDASFIC
jgi:hypothetical protein